MRSFEDLLRAAVRAALQRVAESPVQQPIVVRRGADKRLRVGPDARPLWTIRGWRRVGNTLVGAYRTPYGSFGGTIETDHAQLRFFIDKPPRAVLYGGHSACFRARGRGRYFVHFGIESRDIDAGIAAIERLIIEALRR